MDINSIHINRLNYEEFFLLYIDGELDATQKLVVGSFLAANPDLETELEMLKEAVLAPEVDIVFDKTFLLKNVGDAINTSNYEEKFLLYVDEELSNNERASVETFVLQHPKLQDDFTLLKQTKLIPEKIACPNKAALNKKERRVVYIQWLRVAVAAVLIGLGYIMIGELLAPKRVDNPVAVYESNDDWGQPLKPIGKNDIPTRAKSFFNDNAVATTFDATSNKGLTNGLVGLLLKPKTFSSSQKQNNSLVYEVSLNESEHNYSKPIDRSKLPIKDSAALVIDGQPNMFAFANNMPPTRKDSARGGGSHIENKMAQSVVYTELDTDTDDKSLALGNITINKDKLRGLIRKASRIIGSKVRTGNKNIAIASFSINK